MRIILESMNSLVSDMIHGKARFYNSSLGKTNGSNSFKRLYTIIRKKPPFNIKRTQNLLTLINLVMY